tara:strand:- start:39125 stop:39253 length:129 start_codon:yes stop_codon:yes gene_type:complete
MDLNNGILLSVGIPKEFTAEDLKNAISITQFDIYSRKQGDVR